MSQFCSLSPQVLRKYKGNSEVFFETGTFEGESVQVALEVGFKTIYSVELSADKCMDARKKFAGYSNVHIILGDSPQIIREMLPWMPEPIIFWLDAHSVGGPPTPTPLMAEIKTIQEYRIAPVTILIDDMRMVGGYWKDLSIEGITQAVMQVDPTFKIAREPNSQAANDVLVAYK